MIKKYNLQDKYMDVSHSGETSQIKYSKNIAFICLECNNNFLGKIEEKIKNQTASEEEEFVWMAKIFLLRWYRTSQIDNYHDMDDMLYLLSITLRHIKNKEQFTKFWTLRKFKITQFPYESKFHFGNNPFGQYIVFDDNAYIFIPILTQENLMLIDKNNTNSLIYIEFLYKFYIYSSLSNLSNYSWSMIGGVLIPKINNNWTHDEVFKMAHESFELQNKKLF